eukprot:364998-Chlamydomonas_euryale.AAC.6
MQPIHCSTPRPVKDAWDTTTANVACGPSETQPIRRTQPQHIMAHATRTPMNLPPRRAASLPSTPSFS